MTIKKEYLAAGLVFIAALAMRVFDLERFPLHHDEANRMAAGADNFSCFFGIPVSCFKGYTRPFASLLILLSRNFFSSPEYAVRMPAVIFGTLTVILVYFLCRQMYGKRTAIFSGLLLAFLPWHIYQSRDAREMVYTPFFGALIFLTFFFSIKKRSRGLFLASCFLLGIDSFYVYGASLTHIFVFLLLLVWLRKEFAWLGRRNLLCGALIVIGTAVPVASLYFQQEIGWSTFRGYHKNPFFGPVFFNLWNNLYRNSFSAVESLFIASRGRLLYAPHFNGPLLVHAASVLIVLGGIYAMIVKRRTADKIIIVWLFSAVIGSLMLISFFLPEYLIAALVPLVIVLGVGLDFCFGLILRRFGRLSALIFIGATVVFMVIVSIRQSVNFYRYAADDLELCRRNSYGCKEAALFLSALPGIDKCSVGVDSRMTALVYLDYYLERKVCPEKQSIRYFVIWAPESHPRDYWQGAFKEGHLAFTALFPGQKPIHTVRYPDGLPALYIYQVELKKGRAIRWNVP